MLILECLQGCYTYKFDPVTLTFDLLHRKSTGFQTLLKDVDSSVHEDVTR